MKSKLNRGEQLVLRAYEKGELKSVKNLKSARKKHTTYAKAFFKKPFPIDDSSNSPVFGKDA
jgi:hypothetical protein